MFCRAVTFSGCLRILFTSYPEQEALDIKSSFKTPQRVVILSHFGITPKADALEKAVVKQSGELRLCFTGRIAVQKT